MSIGDLHKLLIQSGHSKVVGVSPPKDNQKPFEDLTPEEMILYFEDALPEEEQAAYNFIKTLDFSQPLPGIPRMDEFINSIRNNENIPKMSRLNLLQVAQLLKSARLEELEGYWHELKSSSLPWLPEEVVKVIEDAAKLYNIPIIDLKS